MPCLAVRVGYAPDVRKEVVEAGGSHLFRCGVGFEQGRGSHVDPPVSALCGKNDCNEELERTSEVQFRLRNRHVLLEPGHNAFVSFFPRHFISMQASSLQTSTLPGYFS